MKRLVLGGVFASLMFCACGGAMTPMPMPAIEQQGVRVLLGVDGNGKVTVKKSAAPMAALSDCQGPNDECAEVSSEVSITLTATPDATFEFLGWEYIDGMPVGATVEGCTFEYATSPGPEGADLTLPSLQLEKAAAAPAKTPSCPNGVKLDGVKVPVAYRIIALFSSMM